MESCSSMKVVMIPWLAMGHLTPFFELSKCLANKGLQIYFITTPKNVARLPKLPEVLSSCIHLVSFPLPHRNEVPDDAESSMDVPSIIQPYLKSRFDLLEEPITGFLEEIRPDWILYDFTSYWIPPLAAKFGISCAYIALFNAATLSFIGPPDALLGNARASAEDYTVAPEWIPFESGIAYLPHETLKFQHSIDAEIATPDTVRFANSISGCDVVAVRSSPEFEATWIDLLGKLYAKAVLPLGYLFPDDEIPDEENWTVVKEWLDEQKPNSVLYVALGSESTLSQEELQELALGLEISGFPFILVLRDPPGSATNVLEMLPEGFETRMVDKGLVYRGWAPQMRILSHPATRGFLTHCGWNSVIEGLGLGRVMVLLPLMNDQGLVARLLEGKGLGVEVERNKEDGSLRRECVANAVRLAMCEQEGEALRTNCRKMRGLFGDKKLNGQYVESFIHYLKENRKSH